MSPLNWSYHIENIEDPKKIALGILELSGSDTERTHADIMNKRKKLIETFSIPLLPKLELRSGKNYPSI